MGVTNSMPPKPPGWLEGGRLVGTTQGYDTPTMGLIIASGGRFIKKLPGIEHAITPCEGIAAAERIRDRVRAMEGGTIAMGFAGNPNEPSSMRGGPVFEFLFGMDQQLRKEGRRERFKLIFFTPADRSRQPTGPQGGRQSAQGNGQARDRDPSRAQAQGLRPDGSTEGGNFDADLIIFMPGMTGNTWFDNTDLPRSPGGLLQADAQCRVPGFERVYVAGDAGSFPGPDWMPKQAHMADLQARPPRQPAAECGAKPRGDLQGRVVVHRRHQ